MRFGRITILAAVIGALWGGIWMTVTGLLLMLITGLVVVPSIGMASLAGLWAGLGVIAISPSSRQRGRLVLASGLLTVLLILLAGGQPFSIALAEGFISQTITLLIWAGLVVGSLALCLDGFEAGSAKRYRVEMLLIRLFKGMGLLLFSVFVALPFYVMVMTSLKKPAIFAQESVGFFD